MERMGSMRFVVAVVVSAVASTSFGAARPFQVSPGGPAFEVASVRINRSGDTSSSSGSTPDGGFAARNQTVKNLIIEAFRIPESRLRGGPGWLASERYDIDARP